MAWFEETFGFAECEYEESRRRFRLDDGGHTLVSESNGRRFHVGAFETPSVAELRGRLAEAGPSPGTLTYEDITGDVGSLHRDPANAGAVFQAASQFNCLEMVGPGITPEKGITIYARDHTQGPACALACPAALVVRQFFAHGDKGQGGAGGQQIDTLSEVGDFLGNGSGELWRVRNGYCIPTVGSRGEKLSSMACVASAISDPAIYAEARGRLRVGVHWDTEVEKRVWRARAGGGWSSGSAPEPLRVCQIYASAVPVAYAKHTTSQEWAPFARLVLSGAYDATLSAAALLARQRKARVTVFLTALGGGVFGNRFEWIKDAVREAALRHAGEALDIKMVHYSRLNSSLLGIADAVNNAGKRVQEERSGADYF